MTLLLTAVWSFLPANIWLTTELIRESVMALFIAVSFYFLIRWMDGGSWNNIGAAMLCSFPAMWLHGVSAALWGGIGFALVFWNRGNRRWALGRRNRILLIAVLAAAVCFISLRLYQYIPYFPSELTLESITHYGNPLVYIPGRTDYLGEIDVKNWAEFALWTVVRSVYFWLSPVVFDWNSWTDPAVALVDALPLAALIVLTFLRPKQKGDGKWLAGIAALLCYTLMFAWGTRNAGTAIRHRNLLLALLLMTCALRHTPGIANEKTEELKNTNAERAV